MENGWNVLVGPNKEKIVRMANDFEPKGVQGNVFGNGKASEKICQGELNEFDIAYR